MPTGPKRRVSTEPLDTSHLEGLAGAERAMSWIESFWIVPDGFHAGEPFRLRGFQIDYIEGLYADSTRIGCMSSGRGNGKTGTLSGLAGFELFDGEGKWSPKVYLAASSQRQAGILWAATAGSVALNEELAARAQVFTSENAQRILTPFNAGELEALPAASKSLQGRRPAFICLDEAAEVDDSTAEALSLSLGKVPGARMAAISTAPLSPDSFWWRWREAGLAGDEALHWLEFSAPENLPIDDPSTWALANPAIEAGFLDPAAIASDLKRVREESFRRWRLNQCVSDAGAWLPYGAFELLADRQRRLQPGERCILAFDGSVNTDSTALVAVTIDERPFVSLLALFERPDGVSDWSVPRQDVETALEAAMAKYAVVELVCDPHWWQSEIQRWEARWGVAGKGGKLLTLGTHVPQRMTAACDAAYALITEGRLSHSGDERLERHVRHCVVKNTSAGAVVVKDHKNSARKIDAAVAMIIGIDRAIYHAHQPIKRRRVAAF